MLYANSPLKITHDSTIEKVKFLITKLCLTYSSVDCDKKKYLALSQNGKPGISYAPDTK